MAFKKLIFAILTTTAGMASFMPEAAQTNTQMTAGEVMFSKDVVPVFNRKCAICHRPGTDTKAPMSLLTYKEARPWAKGIKAKILRREMPPAGAAQLNQQEIDAIVAWVDLVTNQSNQKDLSTTPTSRNEPEKTETGQKKYSLMSTEETRVHLATIINTNKVPRPHVPRSFGDLNPLAQPPSWELPGTQANAQGIKVNNDNYIVFATVELNKEEVEIHKGNLPELLLKTKKEKDALLSHGDIIFYN